MERKRSQRSIDAERRFREQLAMFNAKPAFEEWLGFDKPHDAICSKGHDCNPYPSYLNKGGKPCRICSNLDSGHAECIFRERVIELGGKLVYKGWRGVGKPHEIVCSGGHTRFVLPRAIKQGQGLCFICSVGDGQRGNADFISMLASMGATLIEKEWKGWHHPHAVRCVKGHTCFPSPKNVIQGKGVCRLCAGKIWNVFYVVVNITANRMKFGITSGDPRPRLYAHKCNNYTEQIRLLTNLPGTTAPDLERLCKSTLRDAGWTPVRGREYFNIGALPTVLDIVDNYPIPTA